MDIREFERNKYYYGKLLTVTDFEIEQQYYAKKAKLTNRIMFGVGIVSGLHITRINETQIAIESGVAIDYEGNIILVSIPLTLTLSNITGYLYDGSGDDNFYLCLRYKEKEKDIVHSSNSHTTSNNELSYNRVVESFELYLRQGLTEEEFGVSKSKKSKKANVDKHFDQSLNEMLKQNSENCICLGKISTSRKEKIGLRSQAYIIDKVDLVPFKQYVYNHDLLKHISSLNSAAPKVSKTEKFTASSESKEIDSNLAHEVNVVFDKHKNNFDFEFGIPKVIHREPMIKTDVIEISLKSNLFAESFISEEIKHGLGEGVVYLDTSIEKSDSWEVSDVKSSVYYGDSDVFTKTDEELDLKNYSIGCILYPEKGTFKLGVKYHGARKDDVLRIRWWAIKAKENL
jgi:hypothetical protein